MTRSIAFIFCTFQIQLHEDGEWSEKVGAKVESRKIRSRFSGQEHQFTWTQINIPASHIIHICMISVWFHYPNKPIFIWPSSFSDKRLSGLLFHETFYLWQGSLVALLACKLFGMESKGGGIPEKHPEVMIFLCVVPWLFIQYSEVLPLVNWAYWPNWMSTLFCHLTWLLVQIDSSLANFISSC